MSPLNRVNMTSRFYNKCYFLQKLFFNDFWFNFFGSLVPEFFQGFAVYGFV